jgi:hypothetical protein
MAVCDQEYVALASRWDNQWDVFVLDPRQGLIGQTPASTLAGAAGYQGWRRRWRITDQVAPRPRAQYC